MKGYTLNFGDEILSGAFPFAYADWATLYGLGSWDAADMSGIHNIFRYVFDIPMGAITNPPLLSISFDANGRVVIAAVAQERDPPAVVRARRAHRQKAGGAQLAVPAAECGAFTIQSSKGQSISTRSGNRRTFSHQ